MTRKGRGFTLIELMMVVAIIGILAAIALPAYQDYTVRGKMVEAFLLAEVPERAVADYYERWGRLPEDNAAAGIYPPEAWHGRSVTAIRVVRGMIEVDVDPKSAPKATVFLRPALNKANPTSPFVWVCNASNAPDGFELQGAPRKEAMPSAKYLPAICR